jgi:hypothetical protein
MTLAGVGTRKMRSAAFINALRHADVVQARTPYMLQPAAHRSI